MTTCPNRRRSLRAIACGLGCVAVSSFALAQMPSAPGTPGTPGTPDQPPTPGPPRPLVIDAPEESRLDNGLRVIVARRPGVQLVTAKLLVLAGAETDAAQRAGTAQLVAGLLTRGSRKHSATQMAIAAEVLGGSLESAAGWNQSSLGITVAKGALDAALGLMREAATEPVFAADELDRLRAQTIDALAVAWTQPDTLATLAAQRLRFGAGPYGHPATGTPVSLARIERRDLSALHRSRYRPDRAVLLLAGDVDMATARTLAARHFGSWRGAAPAAAPVATPDEAAHEAERTAAAGFESGLPLRHLIIDMPNSGQASVALFVPVPPRGADRAAADVMNGVLGGGFSSRLNAEIRIRRGLSYGAGSRMDARRDGGLLLASAQTRNETAADVAGLLQAAFDRLIAEPVPTDELAARKATLIGEFSRAVETTAGLNSVVAALVVAGLPTAGIGQRISDLSAVTAADVQRFAAAQLGATGRRLVIAGEADRFRAALERSVTGGAEAVVTVGQRQLDFDSPTGLQAGRR